MELRGLIARLGDAEIPPSCMGGYVVFYGSLPDAVGRRRFLRGVGMVVFAMQRRALADLGGSRARAGGFYGLQMLLGLQEYVCRCSAMAV